MQQVPDVENKQKNTEKMLNKLSFKENNKIKPFLIIYRQRKLKIISIGLVFSRFFD